MEPNDTDQGALGNCWLMAGIAGLVEEQPDQKNGYRIKALFGLDGNLTYGNDVGAYVNRLNRAGVWKYVVVDDYLPVCDKSLKPMFATNKQEDNELWVAILEKAFAKVYGSYGNLQNGRTLQAVTEMTQDPSTAFVFDKATELVRLSDAAKPGSWDEEEDSEDEDGPLEMNLDSFFAKLTQWDEQRFVMCLSTPGKDMSGYMDRKAESHEIAKLHKMYQRMGLETGHAYTLLGVRRVNAMNGNEYRLLQIRNPWGNARGEFRGDFGDNSPLWDQIHEHDKEAMGYTKQDDGIFWMTLNDVFKYFCRGGVSFVMDSKSTLSCRGLCLEDFGPTFAIHLKNNTPGAQITTMVSQIPARGKGSTQDLLGLKLRLLQRRDGDKYECPTNGHHIWETNCLLRSDVGSAFALEKGEYILTAATRFQRRGKFTLTVHTGPNVKCDMQPFKIGRDCSKARFLNAGKMFSGCTHRPFSIDVRCRVHEDDVDQYHY
ncbi:Calpain-type cysteine protease DEK1 [Seminavis robusta]|uniref:Calpain-type cysteine protease DEK1 n=1 Tax=Seminavis robusta TaxID=568900 RepID=A0A9N8EIK7_9STRA|nr:Calpain-type cysteine protease DEK1 [Seminavis robusta]|eukprot:Sro1049_g235350.1 Calpain-type cysteine protease DEK1 (486) ;mRNA; f:9676-11133